MFIYNQLTLCCLLFVSLGLVVLFCGLPDPFKTAATHYVRGTERSTIQAIVEEHYERYMDQEEEYNRENPQSY